MTRNDFQSLPVLTLAIILQSGVLICSGAVTDLDATDGSESSSQKPRDSNCLFNNCNPENPVHLSAGIVVSTSLGIVVCFAVIILAVCYLCGCCCFAGRNRNEGEIHTHRFYPPASAQDLTLTRPHPQQEVSLSYLSGPYQPQHQHLQNQSFYKNTGLNPVDGAPFHMKPQHQSEC